MKRFTRIEEVKASTEMVKDFLKAVRLDPTQNFRTVFGHTLRRYMLPGVPGRRFALWITENMGEESYIVEIGEIKGSYSGESCPSISIRPWNPESRYQGYGEAYRMWIERVDRELTVRIVTKSANHIYRLETLPDTLEGYDIPSIVLWHFRRYYSFLPFDEVKSLAESFESLHPELRSLSLSEANRLASRDIYELARRLGWCKLTTKMQERYGMRGTQWEREEMIAKRKDD